VLLTTILLHYPFCKCSSPHACQPFQASLRCCTEMSYQYGVNRWTPVQHVAQAGPLPNQQQALGALPASVLEVAVRPLPPTDLSPGDVVIITDSGRV
jgi:hypothetical protein